MKKHITLSIIFIFSLSLNAQSLLPKNYGVKIGTNIATVTSTSNVGVENLDMSTASGITGGFYMQIPLTDVWYVNTELLFTQKNSTFNFIYFHDYPPFNDRDEYSTTNILKLSYLDLNPTLSYRAIEKVSLNFGPSISFLIAEDYEFTEQLVNEISSNTVALDDGIYQSESMNFGLNFGLSYYLLSDLLLDLNVNAAMMSMGTITKTTQLDQITADANNYDLKNVNFIISFAYLF